MQNRKTAKLINTSFTYVYLASNILSDRGTLRLIFNKFIKI